MAKALLLLFTALVIGAGVQTKTMNRSELSLLSRSKPDDVLYSAEGIASYYANAFDGRTTSNGEVFDMEGLTAAHQSFPFNTIARVTDLMSGRSVKVRINDRGPFWENRIIDLSRGAAEGIGILDRGIALVKVDVIKWGG
ncbi:MAG: septal ring lytic transglycosylase RlpA family protein [Bacteroidota bacterium]